MNSYESKVNKKIFSSHKNIDKEKINKIKSAKRKKLRIFDEIETKDNFIKNNYSKIKRIKAELIKELIYTNKHIPKNWQNKKNYQNQVHEIFSKDLQFLQYLGKGYDTYSGQKISSETKEKENNKASIDENNKDNKNVIINSLNKKMKNKNKKLTPSPISEKLVNIKEIKYAKTTPNKNNYIHKKDNSMKTKEVINILDELELEHPIKDKINDLFPKEEIEKINSTFKNYQPIIDERKRKQVFKNNICLNLISSYKDKKVQNKRKFKENKFNKEINLVKLRREMIKNPLVLKNLERINFYGPQYSYCSQCGIKNIDFYQKLPLKQLNSITNEIRKYRNLI